MQRGDDDRVNGLAGVRLAPSPLLATLTVTGYVLGTALTTLPASYFMKRYGRRSGFMLGTLLAGICIAIGIAGMTLMHFWWALLLLGQGWDQLNLWAIPGVMVTALATSALWVSRRRPVRAS